MTTDTLDLPIIDEAALDKPMVPAETTKTAVAVDVKSIKELVIDQLRAEEPALAALAEKYRDVAFNVSTTKGMDEAKAARLDLRENGRFKLQRAEERIKAEVNALKKDMAPEIERLISITKPVEDSIHEQIDAEEKRKAAEKERKAQGDAFRKALHLALIDKINGYVTAAEGLPAERIEKGIAHVEAMQFGAETQEFAPQYEAAKQSTLTGLRKLQTAAKEREAIEAQRLENERIAAEQAEAQRKLDEQAAALKRQSDELAARQAVAAIKWPEPAPIAAVVEVEKLLDPGTSACRPTVAAASEDLITTGAINERLAGVTVKAEFLKSLGFTSVKRGAAEMWPESDLPLIVTALITHLHKLLPERIAA